MAKFNLGGMIQGLAGNMQEQDINTLKAEYGKYLFGDEQISNGYKLLRDMILFTDIRIIFIDKQGATGKKTSFKSIYLMNIVDVEMETAGAGLDDSEITITYMANIKRQAHAEVFLKQKFEFPKAFDIVPLYTMLGSLGYSNRLEINEKK